MTLRPFALGQLAFVRARVSACHAHSAIMRIPMMKLDAEMPVEVPISEIFLPPSTDAAAQAAQLLVAQLTALLQVARRTQAEIYELGGHALIPPAER